MKTVFILLSGALYVCSFFNYLLFHSLYKMFIIGVSLGIFFIAWNAQDKLETAFFLIIGESYLFVSFIEVLHILSYKGMGVFTGNDVNLPSQLWIASGYFLSSSFLFATFFTQKKINPNKSMLAFFIVTTIVVSMIFQGVFPNCYIENVGLTSFAKISECVICLIYCVIIWRLHCLKQNFSLIVWRTFGWGILFTIASHMSLIVFVDVYGCSNMASHCFQIISFFCIYKALLETSILRPFDLVFHDLTKNQNLLNKRIKERTRELNEKDLALLRSNADLNELAVIISHDLREPLRGINNLAYLLEEKHASTLTDEALLLVRRISLSAHRVNKQIQSLMDYLYIDHKQIKKQWIDLNVILKQALKSLEHMIKNNDITIVCNFLPKVIANEAVVQSVLMNLISNAIKYNDRDTKSITVGCLASPRNVKHSSPIFFVMDNGIGIPAQHCETIFKVFYRLHGKDEYGGGTGAGLALVRKMLERHGGWIVVDSEEGVGSTFYFMF